MQIESFDVQVHAQTVEAKTKLLSSPHVEVDELVELMSGAATAEAGNKSACMADIAETEGCHSYFVQNGAATQVRKLLDLVPYDRREELDIEVLPEAVGSECYPQLFAASHDVMDGRKTQKLRENMKYFGWKICKGHAERNLCIILLWE